MEIIGVIGEALINISPISSQFASDLKKQVGEGVDAATTENEAAFTKMGQLGGQAILGLTAGLVAVGVEAVHMADTFEVSHARLEASFAANGESIEQWQGKIDAADNSGAKFGFTSSQIEDALGRLETVVKKPATALSDLAVAEDIAKARGMDLTAAAQLVGKASEGTYTSLTKLLGVNKSVVAGFTSGADAVAYLGKAFAGQAQAQADTFSGKLLALKATGEDLGVTLGLAIIPRIEELASALLAGAGFVEQHRTAQIALAVAIGGPVLFAIGSYVVGLVGMGVAHVAAAASAVAHAASEVASWLGITSANEAGAAAVAAAAAEAVAAHTAETASSAAMAAAETAVTAELVSQYAERVAAETGTVEAANAAEAAQVAAAAATAEAIQASTASIVAGYGEQVAAEQAASLAAEEGAAASAGTGLAMSAMLGPIGLAVGALGFLGAQLLNSGNSLKANTSFANDFVQSLGNVPNKIDLVKQEIADMNGQIDAASKQWEKLANSGAPGAEALDGQINGMKSDVKGLQAQLKALETQSRASAAAQKAVGDATDDAGTDAATAADALKKQEQAQGTALANTVGLTTAQNGFATAVNNAAITLATNNDVMDQSTIKGQANQAAIDSMVQSISGYINAAAAAGVPQDQMNAQLVQMVANFDGVLRGAGLTTQAILDMNDKLGLSQYSAAAAAQGVKIVGTAAQQAAAPVETLSQKVSDLSQEMSDTAGAQINLAKAQSDLADKEQALSDAFDRTKLSIAAEGDQIDKLIGQQVDASNQALGTVEAYQKLTDAFDRNTLAANAESDAMDRLIGIPVDASNAAVAYQQKLDALTASVVGLNGVAATGSLVWNDTAQSLDITTKAGQDAVTAINDTISAMTAQADALLKTGASSDTVTGVLGSHITQLNAALIAGGLSQAQVSALDSQYGLIPDNITKSVAATVAQTTALDANTTAGQAAISTINDTITAVENQAKAMLANGATVDQVNAFLQAHITTLDNDLTAAGLSAVQVSALNTQYGLNVTALQLAVAQSVAASTSLDQNTAAGRANQGMLLDLQQAVYTLGQDTFAATGNINTANSAMADQKNKLMDLETHLGLADKGIQNMNTDWALVPAAKQTAVQATVAVDSTQAQKDLAALQVLYDSSPAALGVTGSTPITGFYSGGITNGPALVGEGNPAYSEVVVPLDPMYRGNAESLTRYAAKSLGMPMLASGGVVGGFANLDAFHAANFPGLLDAAYNQIGSDTTNVEQNIGNAIVKATDSKAVTMSAILAEMFANIPTGTGAQDAVSAIALAHQWIGTPYQWGGGHGGSVPIGTPVDCSGLVDQIFGITGVTTTQEYLGTAVAGVKAALPADLVFYGPRAPGESHHVGIYTHDGLMIDAPHTGAFVREEPLFSDLSFIRRIVPQIAIGALGGSVALPGGGFVSLPDGSGIASDADAATQVLNQLGFPVTGPNVSSMVTWAQRESGSAWPGTGADAPARTHNPWNTTMSALGAISMNSAGVKIYPDWATGLHATAQTISNGYYPHIVASLRSGLGLSKVDDSDLSKWGTGPIFDSGGWLQPTPPGTVGTYQNHTGVPERVLAPGQGGGVVFQSGAIQLVFNGPVDSSTAAGLRDQVESVVGDVLEKILDRHQAARPGG